VIVIKLGMFGRVSQFSSSRPAEICRGALGGGQIEGLRADRRKASEPYGDAASARDRRGYGPWSEAFRQCRESTR